MRSVRSAPHSKIEGRVGFSSSMRTNSFCLGILLTLAALTVDYTIAPVWYSSSPILALFVLLVLVYRKNGGRHSLGVARLASWQRLSVFGGGHALIAFAGYYFASSLQLASSHYSMAATAIVAGKLIVLFPSLAFLPAHPWRMYWQRFKPEMFAALVVMLTFFPYRLFQIAFARYSGVLGAVTYRAALLFVPGLRYVAGPNPILSGPSLDVQIVFGCCGLDAINLFDCLFGLALLLEWSRFNKVRALVSYVVGFGTMLTANVIRLVLLVTVGNLISAEWIARVHLNAGWLFFSIVFLGFMSFAYPFMLIRRDSQSSAPSTPPGPLMQESASGA